jgi:hypothetical protein
MRAVSVRLGCELYAIRPPLRSQRAGKIFAVAKIKPPHACSAGSNVVAIGLQKAFGQDRRNML